MKIHNARIWVVGIALAFLVLWCVSVNVAYAGAGPEALDEPAAISSQVEKVGIAGWCVVGVGFFEVAVTAFLCCRTPRKRRRVRGRRHGSSPIYSPTPAHRYQRTVERRK